MQARSLPGPLAPGQSSGITHLTRSLVTSARSQAGSVAFFAQFGFVANFEPKDVGHALSDSHWVNAMHEELENFDRN